MGHLETPSQRSLFNHLVFELPSGRRFARLEWQAISISMSKGSGGLEKFPITQVGGERLYPMGEGESESADRFRSINDQTARGVLGGPRGFLRDPQGIPGMGIPRG